MLGLFAFDCLWLGFRTFVVTLWRGVNLVVGLWLVGVGWWLSGLLLALCWVDCVVVWFFV